MVTSQFLKLKKARGKKRPGKLSTNASSASSSANASLDTNGDNNGIDNDCPSTPGTMRPQLGSHSAPSSPLSVADSGTLGSPMGGKRAMLRTINQFASRTFQNLTIPKSSSPALSQQISPLSLGVSKRSPRSPVAATNNLIESDNTGRELADPPGDEAYHCLREGAAEVGAWTAAGWQLVPDSTGGTGIPRKARKPNQDSFVALSLPGGRLCLGVYDGHGMHGREASQLVRDFIPVNVSSCLDSGLLKMRSLSQPIISSSGSSSQNSPSSCSPSASDARRRSQIAKALQHAFVDAERALRDSNSGVDHAFSGTTATTLIYDAPRRDLFCAWAGDSRALLLVPEGNSKWHVRSLSADHKPTRRDEKKRIRAAGGRVTRFHRVGPLRVWLPDEWLPGLAMTKSIGDTVLSKYGVTASPDVSYTRLSGSTASGLTEARGDSDENESDEGGGGDGGGGTIEAETGPEAGAIIIAASDGVWEFMTNDDVARLVLHERSTGASAQDVAKRLVEHAVRKWQQLEPVVDDTTAIVTYLPRVDDDEEEDDEDDGDGEPVHATTSKHENGRFGGWGRRLRLLRKGAAKGPRTGSSTPRNGAGQNDEDEERSYTPMLLKTNGKLETLYVPDEDIKPVASGETDENQQQLQGEIDSGGEEDAATAAKDITP